MKLLIADDHDLLKDTLVLFVEGEGSIETVTASDLDEALAIVDAQGPFDLIMLDYNMPGMSGLTGLKRALTHNGEQKVALMSGIAKRSVAEEALALGAAGFIPKTISAKSLINAVKFMAMGEKYAPIDFMTAEDAVNQVIEMYIESMEKSSGDMVTEAFHENAKVVGYLNGDFLQLSTSDFEIGRAHV